MSATKNRMQWNTTEDKILEEEMLKTTFNKESYIILAETLNRTEDSVKSRASKLRSKWKLKEEIQETFKPKEVDNSNDYVIVQGKINFGAITLEGEFTIKGAFTIKPIKNT